MTTRDLERQLKLSRNSIKRRLDRYYAKGIIDTRYGVNDELPQEIISMILDGSAPQPVKKDVPRKTKTPEKTVQVLNETARPEPEAPAPRVLDGTLFDNKLLALIAASLFVGADGASCGWIIFQAYNGHQGGELLQIIATVLFFFAGAGIGFTAIRFIIKYDGYNMQVWSLGFGLFQIAVHSSALGFFEQFWSVDVNLAIGEAFIVIGLMIATSAIAMSFRTKKVK